MFPKLPKNEQNHCYKKCLDISKCSQGSQEEMDNSK